MLTCCSVSETFSLAGLASSVIIIPNNEMNHKFRKYLDMRHISVNLLEKVALEAAYKYGEENIYFIKTFIH